MAYPAAFCLLGYLPDVLPGSLPDILPQQNRRQNSSGYGLLVQSKKTNTLKQGGGLPSCLLTRRFGGLASQRFTVAGLPSLRSRSFPGISGDFRARNSLITTAPQDCHKGGEKALFLSSRFLALWRCFAPGRYSFPSVSANSGRGRRSSHSEQRS